MTKDDIKKGLEFCKADWCAMCPYCNCIGCAGSLKQDALNLITEQEKENEQLEEQIEELRNEKFDAQDDLDCYYDEMPTKIKQAKIDVLNELRKKYSTSGNVNNDWATYVYVDDIDEMIKEIEK